MGTWRRDSGANRDAGEQVEGGREASTWTGGGGTVEVDVCPGGQEI